MGSTQEIPLFLEGLDQLDGPYFAASVVENNVHACMASILTGLHLITLCTCTTRWLVLLHVYIMKDPKSIKAIGGTGVLTSPYRVERDIRYIFPHPYCGGNLSRVDLAVLQLWVPWPLTRNLAVAPLHLDANTTYFDYVFETKALEAPYCRTLSWWRYGLVQPPFGSSPKLNETAELHTQVAKVVDMHHCYPFQANVQGEIQEYTKIHPNFELSKLCVLRTKVPWKSCGTDKGSPILCLISETIGWRMYGIGLGGAQCYSRHSLELYQGFTNALSFLRLYLGMDLTLKEHKVKPHQGSERKQKIDNLSLLE
ncbi:hypothetical protein GE061_009310 [Apolygus lucorum]|uniref:Uncharacterized protein n=1 Tax=Apolygus lucorum TaxID=248454 RepID=A0A6A4KID9_APOLU|nr:hypothetical protein GE061_009310 [Apolygus lucorum]